jgi:ligand-binding sensor domain-containing protein/C4-dicarboxylate-specific signal transduction histidine kinase
MLAEGHKEDIPTLARIAFWIPPERKTEFQTEYQLKILPTLVGLGLKEWKGPARATVDSTFSQVFEFRSASEFGRIKARLAENSTWHEVLGALGQRFSITESDDRIKHTFNLYSLPAGGGTTRTALLPSEVRAGTGRGNWRSFDATDGLVGTRVRAILQDREGYLWFTTEGSGIYRYDGQTFVPFTTADGLAHDSVFWMIEDHEGFLWVGTANGVSRYDGKSFTNYSADDGLGTGWVFWIFEDKDHVLWFATVGGGLTRFDRDTFRTYSTEEGLPHSWIVSATQDLEGNIWLGTYGGGVSRFDGESFTNYDASVGLAHNTVWPAFADRRGSLWFGTQGGGVSRYDGKKFTTYTTRDGLPHNVVSSIFQDRDGLIWMGTAAGVCSFDGKDFRVFTSSHGLVHDTVYSVFQDREGYMWFGTDGGVSRYDGGVFTTFTAADGLPGDENYLLYEDRKGHIWIASGHLGGSPNGVTRYDGKSFLRFNQESGLPGNDIRSIQEDVDGNIWFATSNGVSRYDGTSFFSLNEIDGLGGGSVYSVFQDRDGDLWFGFHGGGVTRYDGEFCRTFDAADGLTEGTVYSIIQDQNGHLWFGTGPPPATRRGGITVFDGQKFTGFSRREGLADDRVYAILEDSDGLLWITTRNGGVSRYDGQSFETIDRSHGLPNNWIVTTYQDRKGYFWCGTRGGGVYRFNPKLDAGGEITFQTLVEADGLASNVVGQILEDREGNFWFGTNRGVTKYRPQTPTIPGVDITGVVADQRYGRVDTLSIPSSSGVTAFEFQGLSTKTRPEAMFFRYRLRGLDDTWKTTFKRRVEYKALPSGNYAFEVASVDRDLMVSDPPARLPVQVLVSYERIAWVGALCLALALLAWQGTRIVRRNQALTREMAERERVEAERTALDDQLQSLRYLERLRSALRRAWSPDDVLNQAGKTIMEILSTTTAGYVWIEHDGRDWSFGDTEEQRQIHHEAVLSWGEQDRGRLHLYYSVELSESQERALLRETAGQISRVLESRELEMQLLQSARLVSLGQTAAGVAHELNQPLSAISNTAGDIYLSLTDGIDLTSESMKEMMQDVLGLVKRMSGTVDHLRIFSREDQDEPVKFSVSDVVRTGLGLVERQLKDHGIRLDVNLEENLPEVQGHPHQIEQVVLNLLNNARDALDGVEVAARHLIIRTEVDDGQVILEVEDSGKGIDPDHVGQVFRPFFTTKVAGEGTGLGLSISYAIVSKHQGEINCESQVGAGTLFRVKLPVSAS